MSANPFGAIRVARLNDDWRVVMTWPGVRSQVPKGVWGPGIRKESLCPHIRLARSS